ncbi:MAG TPA: hypothetical protein VFV79_02295, partial [Saprospiraceae bacterium]|nr:hypothetical protein [Saprospiraceae bacterium]
MRTLIFFAILFLVKFNLLAQWESMHGPFGSYINDLGQNNHYVFAATTAGIYRSADAGLNWTHISFTGDTRFACLQFDVHDSVMVADAIETRPDTSIRRMYKSVDDGNSWVEIPRPPVNRYVEIAVVGNTILANDLETIWITKDDGLQWKHSNVNHNFDYVGCFERYGSKVYVGAGEDLFVFEGYDNNWKNMSISIAYHVDYVFVKDSLILVRDYNSEALYISEDNGLNWFNSPGSQWNTFPNYFAFTRDTLYATGYNAMYVSADHGHSWETRQSKAPHFELSLIAVNSILLLGQQYSGIYRSTDFGRNFHFSSQGMDASYVQKLFFYKDQLLTGGTLQGVFNYSFENHQWQRTYLDEYFDAECFDFEESNGHLIIAAYYVLWYEPSTGKWIKNSPEGYGIDRLYSDLYKSPFGLLAVGNKYSFGPMSIYKGFDNWRDFNEQFFDDTVSVRHYAQNTQCLFVSTSSRVARTFGVGQHWEWLPSFIDPHTFIYDLIAFDNAIFAIQAMEIHAHCRLYVSYDNGLTWTIADD